jgi:hypothetical protein
MHPDANMRQSFCMIPGMSRRQAKRRSVKPRTPASRIAEALAAPLAVVREATRVERLVFTRTQAAEALGISRSTFNRRVLPIIETVEMPWGTRLIPADELERLIAERRRPAREQPQTPARPGRPAALSPELVEQIRAERDAGQSLAQIARGLNAAKRPTAHGGARWWPSTVRAVLDRIAT